MPCDKISKRSKRIWYSSEGHRSSSTLINQSRPAARHLYRHARRPAKSTAPQQPLAHATPMRACNVAASDHRPRVPMSITTLISHSPERSRCIRPPGYRHRQSTIITDQDFILSIYYMLSFIGIDYCILFTIWSHTLLITTTPHLRAYACPLDRPEK